MATVYVLKDPISKQVVYVGQTKKPLHVRLIGHTMQKSEHKKCKWIERLAEINEVPIIEVVEEVPENISCLSESKWIKHFKELGATLFNLPVGGYRKNAKRPLKYGEVTVSIPTRVPVSKKDLFKKKVATILKQWEVKQPASHKFSS